MGAMLTTMHAEDLPLRASGHVCADCGEPLHNTEEVWRLEVVRPQQIEGKVLLYPVLDEEDVEGGFCYEPYFFCFDCGETQYRDLQKTVQDDPPIEDELSAHECTCCGSGIRDWEAAGAFTLGEFHVSRRSPNGVSGAKFQLIDKPELVCLYCLTVMNEGQLDMWDDLSQDGACPDCIQVRCWRCPAACDCPCHHEPDQG